MLKITTLDFFPEQPNLKQDFHSFINLNSNLVRTVHTLEGQRRDPSQIRSLPCPFAINFPINDNQVFRLGHLSYFQARSQGQVSPSVGSFSSCSDRGIPSMPVPFCLRQGAPALGKLALWPFSCFSDLCRHFKLDCRDFTLVEYEGHYIPGQVSPRLLGQEQAEITKT